MAGQFLYWPGHLVKTSRDIELEGSFINSKNVQFTLPKGTKLKIKSVNLEIDDVLVCYEVELIQEITQVPYKFYSKAEGREINSSTVLTEIEQDFVRDLISKTAFNDCDLSGEPSNKIYELSYDEDIETVTIQLAGDA